MRIALAVMLLLAALPSAAGNRRDFPIRNGQRVVFLGDSNTFAGGVAQYFEAFLFTRFPESRIEVINLGLPSETVSGLSEPDHPYPRPCLFERLDRALAKTRPDWVIACYGMNDGIYYPPSAERFKAYQEAIRRLVRTVKAAGARMALLTPPPFDAGAIPKDVLPEGAPKYSWLHPYAKYDDALAEFSRWLLDERPAWVIDTRAPLVRALAAMRRVDPAFRFAGDGVHFDSVAAFIIAQTLIEALGGSPAADSTEIDFEALKSRSGAVTHLRRDGGALGFTWLPHLPISPPAGWRRVCAAAKPVLINFNQLNLAIRKLPPGRYRLTESGVSIAEATQVGWRRTCDLAAEDSFSPARRAAELMELVRQRERLLALAWLTDVGHKRPDTPVGKPLAVALREAAALESQIRALAKPSPVTLRLEPVR